MFLSISQRRRGTPAAGAAADAAAAAAEAPLELRDFSADKRPFSSGRPRGLCERGLLGVEILCGAVREGLELGAEAGDLEVGAVCLKFFSRGREVLSEGKKKQDRFS